MRICIPLLGDRVAPRCSIADVALLLTVNCGHVSSQVRVSMVSISWSKFVGLLDERGVDTLVCGGITQQDRKSVRQYNITVIDNVACTVDEVVDAINRGMLMPGFGIVTDQTRNASEPATSIERDSDEPHVVVDCMACTNRRCCYGEPCPHQLVAHIPHPDKATHLVLESAQDVMCEDERKLCRIAELVYFCLGLKYQTIGIAFCLDLFEPAASSDRWNRRLRHLLEIVIRVKRSDGVICQ